MILLVVGLFTLIGRLFSTEPMLATAIVAIAIGAGLSVISKVIYRVR